MHIVGLMKTTLLDYPGKVASTIFTGGCNFRCPYCHNGDLVLKASSITPYSLDEIFAHLNKRKGSLGGVCITGGEPTLQSDLTDFIKKIKSLNLSVKLDTNGTNPKMLRLLLEEHLIDYVAMDIKHSKNKYNVIACMNNFDIAPICESAELLISSDIDYEFRTTVVKEYHTYDDFKDIGEWIGGSKNYFLQPYKESEQVIVPGHSTYSSDEFNEIMVILSDYNIGNIAVRTLD